MTIRPTRRTAVIASLSAVLIAVATIAACAPPKKSTPPPTTTTTTAGPTTSAGPTTTAAPTTTIPVTTTTLPAPTCTVNTLVAQPNPIPVGTLPPGAYSYLNKDIDVCHNSPASVNKPTFITQCYESAASPTFNYLSSCSNLSEIPQNPNASATVVTSFPAFYGTEPSGDKDWGCFKAGDTAPAGITKYSTCYLRFTVDIEANTTDQLFTPITFS